MDRELYLNYVPKVNDYIDVIENEIIYTVNNNILKFRFDPDNYLIILDIFYFDKNEWVYSVEIFDKSTENRDKYISFYKL